MFILPFLLIHVYWVQRKKEKLDNIKEKKGGREVDQLNTCLFAFCYFCEAADTNALNVCSGNPGLLLNSG